MVEMISNTEAIIEEIIPIIGEHKVVEDSTRTTVEEVDFKINEVKEEVAISEKGRIAETKRVTAKIKA
jgi:hypothetical protein